MKLTAVFLLGCALLLLPGCGGAGKASSTPPTTTPPPPPVSNNNNNQGNAVGPPPSTKAIINVAAGQTSGGVDITVPAPRASTPPNAQLLGAGPPSSTITASNTGATIPRGSAWRIIAFGPGLDANTQVSITGPGDITVDSTSIRAITSEKTGTPGISFGVTVAPSAALGVRTVIFENPQGDVSTFTAGLEVVP